MQRSRFLTYWTGKDISCDAGTLTDNESKRYLDRLLSILEEGFWMTTPKEVVTGWSARTRGSYIQYETPMTCFTELRPSRAQVHSSHYGLLGIAVDRSYILARWGGPVLYTRSHPDEAVVGNLKEALSWIERQRSQGLLGADQVHRNLLHVAAFMKSMSLPEKDDFIYLDEREWRIIFASELLARGLVRATASKTPEYKLPLLPSDLRVLVVPDDAFRRAALGSTRVQQWLANHHVPCVTVAEAMHL